MRLLCIGGGGGVEEEKPGAGFSTKEKNRESKIIYIFFSLEFLNIFFAL
jgi:hypothetical protein